MRWITDLVFLVVLGLAVFYARGAIASSRSPGPRASASIRVIPGLASHVRPASAIGSETATVDVVEFSDFQCPFCAVLADTLRQFRKTRPHVRILYRHYPLERIHPVARAAAEASECARLQGAFEAYHDVLFAERRRLPSADWTRLAAQAGIRDTSRFKACLGTPPVRDRVALDIAAARSIGLTGTPALLIGKTLIEGVPSMRKLDSLIRMEAARAP